jgi:hypothetical protein
MSVSVCSVVTKDATIVQMCSQGIDQREAVLGHLTVHPMQIGHNLGS